MKNVSVILLDADPLDVTGIEERSLTSDGREVTIISL